MMLDMPSSQGRLFAKPVQGLDIGEPGGNLTAEGDGKGWGARFRTMCKPCPECACIRGGERDSKHISVKASA